MDQDKKTLCEAIDCCRPGSDDVHAPEMAFLAEALEADAGLRTRYERSREFDAQLGRLFREVDVPPGLEQHLLATIASASEAAAISDSPHGMAAIVGSATDQTATPTPTSARDFPHAASPVGTWTSAGALRYLAAAGTAAVVLIAVTVFVVAAFRPQPTEISRDELLRQTGAAVSAAVARDGWENNLAKVPDHHEFPFESVDSEPAGWQSAPLSIDSQAVAYLLEDRRGSEVVLLAARSPARVTGLTRRPALVPATGEQSVAAWQIDSRLYVLVVRGHDHAQRYGRIIREPGMAYRVGPRKVSPV